VRGSHSHPQGEGHGKVRGVPKIEEKIAHYREMASYVMDLPTLDSIDVLLAQCRMGPLEPTVFSPDSSAATAYREQTLSCACSFSSARTKVHGMVRSPGSTFASVQLGHTLRGHQSNVDATFTHLQPSPADVSHLADRVIPRKRCCAYTAIPVNTAAWINRGVLARASRPQTHPAFNRPPDEIPG
jgi:hypothetical protein